MLFCAASYATAGNKVTELTPGVLLVLPQAILFSYRRAHRHRLLPSCQPPLPSTVSRDRVARRLRRQPAFGPPFFECRGRRFFDRRRRRRRRRCFVYFRFFFARVVVVGGGRGAREIRLPAACANAIRFSRFQNTRTILGAAAANSRFGWCGPAVTGWRDLRPVRTCGVREGRSPSGDEVAAGVPGDGRKCRGKRIGRRDDATTEGRRSWRSSGHRVVGSSVVGRRSAQFSYRPA